MNFLKKVFFASVMLGFALTLFSCQDSIYENIRKEVTLKDGTVPGCVRTLTRFGSGDEEYIYLSNGASVYRKKNSRKTEDHSYGNWEKVSSNIEGKNSFIIDIVADSTYLYAFVGTWEENTNKGQNRWNNRIIYSSSDEGKTWEKVTDIRTSPTATSNDNSPLNLFCTNTLNPNNRKAYYNHNGEVYSLSGTTSTKMTLGDENAKTTPTKKSTACAALGSTVYFFDRYDTYYGSAACTNEYYDDAGNVVDGTVYYYGESTRLCWGDSSGKKDQLSAGDRIFSLAVTKDYILAGTLSGIKHFSFSPNSIDEPTKISGSKIDFATNAAAIMTSSYEVNTLLVINPEKNETETAIYSAIDFEGRSQQFDHACLWAYYPSRGNWNRD